MLIGEETQMLWCNGMIWSKSKALILLLIIVLVTSSGCTMLKATENSTPARIGTSEEQAIISSAPSPTAVVQATTLNAQTVLPDRSSLNVVRNEPFTINGTVDNLSITKVQVWILDGNISTTIVPVMSDGSFQITLDSQLTAALPRNMTSVVVIQYPSPPDHFMVMRNGTTGKIVDTETGSTTSILAHLTDTGTYPTTQVDYLEQGIEAAGNNVSVYFMNGVDAWITIDPVGLIQPGSLVVTGNTSLPAGTSLSISVATLFEHPTPKNYDFSHEFAEGTAVVSSGIGGTNRYSGIINTSLLNTGMYNIIVDSQNDALQADATTAVDIIAKLPASPKTGNYINWSCLALPPLMVNETMLPVMLEGEWQIVLPGTQTKNNEVPYGSIIDCGPDGICRGYTSGGIQFLAVYDSNEAHTMEVPNGAMVDGGSVGNVTFIKLNGSVILTKIDEYPSGS